MFDAFLHASYIKPERRELHQVTAASCCTKSRKWRADDGMHPAASSTAAAASPLGSVVAGLSKHSNEPLPMDNTVIRSPIYIYFYVCIYITVSKVAKHGNYDLLRLPRSSLAQFNSTKWRNDPAGLRGRATIKFLERPPANNQSKCQSCADHSN